MRNKTPSPIIRLLREAGGFHLLAFALVACTSEALGKVFLTQNGGAMLDSFLAHDSTGALSALYRLIGFVLLMAVGIVVKDSLLGSYQERGMVRLRLRTVKALGRSRMDWLDGRHTGELSARVSGDLNALAGALRPVLIMGISLIIVQMINVGYLFSVNWRLTLMTFGIVPVTSSLQWAFASPIKKYNAAKREAMGQLSSVVFDGAGSVETVKSLSLEGEMLDRFDKAQERQRNAALREQKILAVLTPLSILGRYLPQMVLVLMGGYFVAEGGMTIGQLTIFLGLSGSVLHVIENFANFAASMRQLGVNAARVVRLWDIPMERQGGVKQGVQGADAVSMEGVTFAYGDGQAVLRGVSLRVKPGEFVALTGESGSGKSTIMKLCASLYDVDSGEVKIRGVPIPQWDLIALRESFAYVSQDTWLFSGTLEENITCGQKAEPDALNRAIDAAGLKAFVQGLKEGLNTQVGERGVFLSGGQRQRIAIARALYKCADILLLDEATSALDMETEALVMEGLNTLPEKPAIIMITHHLANAGRANRRIQIEGGRIRGEGALS